MENPAKSPGKKPSTTTADESMFVGNAATVIFLLRDYESFGHAERVFYHFDLIESQDTFSENSSLTTSGSHPSVSGVARLLECSPLTPIHRLSKRQKRMLRTQIRAFNGDAEKAVEERSAFCYKPDKLPLRVNPSTRLFFAYEATRIAFCIDASPSLTSTFGVTGKTGSACCPLDRVSEMARTYFQSLVEPVSAPSMSRDWRPSLSVTVIAVFPLGKTAESSLLVRDFRVEDTDSAKLLADHIDEWIHTDVEEGISERMCRPHAASTWGMPLYSSSMRDILEAGDYALSILSSEARPLLVVATDCRSVSCDGIVDVFLDIDRVDVPITVLDLSMPETHTTEQPLGSSALGSELTFLTYDPGGPAAFPLHLSDDAEALYGICRATGGCFLDSQRLDQLSNKSTGQVPTSDAPYQNAVKRLFVKMNGIQWLTLFSQSPLSPTFHSSWGKLAPPQYLQKRMGTANSFAPSQESQPTPAGFDLVSPRSTSRLSEASQSGTRRSQTHVPITFSTYVVSPIRIKALLLMRMKEGYRVKQWGLSTQDADKVFIQFTLPLELGTVLHYELSFRALSNQNHMIGSSHIKIELSGDAGFIQSVKTDFLNQTQDARPFTMAQKISSRLCQVLRWIRREDCLLSYLSPPMVWPDQLPGPFVRRLDTMTTLQRRRHFTVDQFDVICHGRMPYAVGDGFLSEFLSLDNGEQELFDFMNEWSTQIVKTESVYIRRTSASDGTTSYCLVELRQSHLSRLFAVNVMFYSGVDPNDRMEILTSLRNSIDSLKDVEVLGKQLGPYLVGLAQHVDWKRKKVEIQHHHEKWDLLKDPELLPLLVKRRAEMGRFRLLEYSDNSAIFAKLIPEPPPLGSPGDLIQYQIEVLSDKVVIELFMESECGAFSPFGSSGVEASRFKWMVHVLRRRDQECGRALFSRTNLLGVFQSSSIQENPNVEIESHKTSVQRMLAYCSKVSIRLRFFSPGAGAANDILFRITENALLSEIFGVRAAKLRIEPTDLIKDEEQGVWFIIQFDRHTMSIVHLALADRQEAGDDEGAKYAYRDLTFFTNGVSDLYSKRDDMVDDDSADSHISEYLCVTEFADNFGEVQRQNFAAAAYLALRSDAQPEVHTLVEGDFAEVIQVCEFVQVANVLVMGTGNADSENVETNEDRLKLYRLINTILRVVPGDEGVMFYCGAPDNDAAVNVPGDGSASHSSMASLDASSESESEDGFFEEMEASQRISAQTPQHKSSHNANSAADQDGSLNDSGGVPQPIFVRFRLDGNLASTKDIQAVTKSTNLSAEISVFKPRGGSSTEGPTNSNLRLPWSHQIVALELRALLKSHVAEQTVERLRHHGYSISEENLRLVRKCLKRVRSVVLSSIELFFYVSKTDSMVSASAPAGGEAEVAEGFLLLETELCSNDSFAFKPAPGGGFLVCSSSQDAGALQYWCLVSIQRSEGTVATQIYHPTGKDKGLAVLFAIEEVVSSAVHRVNQHLLLKRLHLSRTASKFLIPAKGISREESDLEVDSGEDARFVPGKFSCPTVFTTVFELYYRCATNPGQVAHTLEATVLHSFAVSNRPGVFVYKDEGGAIFYMSVEPIGSGIDGDGKVGLLVHGISEPGPSLTMQLRTLLQRRILQVASDMLSSVLTKNPHFNWKQADIDFLRSFDSEWMAGDGDKTSPQDCYYEFPGGVYDPCMVLLMFRQNICGSTFFHRLNDVGHEGLSPAIEECRDVDAGGVLLRWNQHDFTLYYNNAPSKLDPTFQGVSTLTPKGAALCREVGSGIAIVELSLVKSTGTPVQEIPFAQPATNFDTTSNPSLASLRFRKLVSLSASGEGDSVCVRVRIINTDLGRSHLHEVIALTLDQALVAWIMERWLEKASLNLLPQLQGLGDSSPVSEKGRMTICDRLCPGLPAVRTIIESSHGLPHPAMSKIEQLGMNRSSSVGTTTLELLEKGILAPLFGEEATSDQLDRAKSSLCILRLSRYSSPQVVTLSWDAKHKKAIVHKSSRETQTQPKESVEDTPVDCPEYLCFCALSQYDGKSKDLGPHVRMYREVMIHDGITERSPSIELLQSIKKKYANAFNRSLAFILSVKRNRRSLWAYNWNPQIVKSVSTRLQEASNVSLQDSERTSFALQYRSLRLLAPSRGSKTTKNDQPLAPTRRPSIEEKDSKPPVESEAKRASSHDKATESVPVPARKIRRPVSIRRPKLIGKSVEGAAMQAVAASRKRASSSQFKNVTTATPTKRQPSQTGARESIKPTRSSSRAADTTPKKQLRLPPGARDDKDRAERDEALIRIRNDFNLICSPTSSRTRRLSYMQREALALLTNVWWPRKETMSIPRSVVEFLLSRAPLSWSDACQMPPVPLGVMDMFIPVFARWITTFTPGLRIVQVNQPKGTAERKSSVFLSTVVKNLRGCKCFIVIKISKSRPGRGSTMIRSQGWVLHLPRRSRQDKKKTVDSNVTGLLQLEKDGAGMNKLCFDTHQSLLLESLLFDFSASMVERAARLPDGKTENLKDLIPTVRSLTSRHPFDQQKRMPILNYRAFEATIVLKSYKDRFIDMFDSQSLFQRLHEEADERDLFRCGAGLCFTRGIGVRGSHSLCFLTDDPVDKSKMLLLILCRTQGRNLSDFMFREGSNVAIHVLDNIVLEAAGLAYKELKFVAAKLRRDDLWKSFSSSPKSVNSELTQSLIYEMLSLTTVRPLLQALGNNITSALPEIATLLGPELEVDWTASCLCMSNDASFSPHWSIQSEGETTYLFYMVQEDVFLLLGVDRKDALARAAIVEKDESVTQERRHIAIQKLLNFLLHFIWKSL